MPISASWLGAPGGVVRVQRREQQATGERRFDRGLGGLLVLDPAIVPTIRRYGYMLDPGPPRARCLIVRGRCRLGPWVPSLPRGLTTASRAPRLALIRESAFLTHETHVSNETNTPSKPNPNDGFSLERRY